MKDIELFIFHTCCLFSAFSLNSERQNYDVLILFDFLKQYFSVLGFDIFIDKKLKPWLLEVNRLETF